MLTLVAGHADLPIIADWLRTHCRAVECPRPARYATSGLNQISRSETPDSLIN